MSDPALSQPPFIPEGTFRCCLCFEVFPEAEAWEGEQFGEYAKWNECVPCHEADAGKMRQEEEDAGKDQGPG